MSVAPDLVYTPTPESRLAGDIASKLRATMTGVRKIGFPQ
jgi:hypothetical protein